MRSRIRVLRQAAVALGLVFLVSAGLAQAAGAASALVIYLSLAGVLALVSVWTVRDTSRADRTRDRGYWQMTGERFRDPATGHTMEIRYNPVTGERDYVDVESS